MFKTLSSFRRTWRLMKVLNNKTSVVSSEQDLANIVGSSAREAFEVSKKIDDSSQETRKLIRSAFDDFEENVRGIVTRSEHAIAATNKQNDLNNEQIVGALRQENAEMRQMLMAFTQASEGRNAKIDGDLNDMRGLLNALREFSSKQSAEALRWKEGYDYKILKSFLIRIIHSADEIDEKIALMEERGASAEMIAEIEFIKDILLSNLDGEGLVRSEPLVGELVDPSDTRYEVRTLRETDDREMDLKIAKVLKPQYSLCVGEGEGRIIRPASVELFKFKEITE